MASFDYFKAVNDVRMKAWKEYIAAFKTITQQRKDAIRKVKEDCKREILRYITVNTDTMSYEEIGKQFGLSLSGIKRIIEASPVRVRRGRKYKLDASE